MSIVKYQEHGLDLACRVEDGQAWMTYEQVAELFGIDRTRAVHHARDILETKELSSSVCAEYAQTASDGKSYQKVHLNQDMVLHIGYRVRSERGSEFRRWATMVLKGEAAPLNRVPPSDPLVAQAEAALALTQTALTITKEFVRLRDEQEAIKLAQACVEERVTQLEEHRQPDPEFFTIMAWAKLIGMRLTLPRAAGLGRRASNMSERLGYSMGTALDPRFGTVNTYHVDILEQVMGARE
jgi:prophage antirepressor-like protein